MEIIIDSLLEGAKRATGLTVIIDVFRACSTAAYLLNNGAKKIIPVHTEVEALELKKKLADCITIGEQKGIQIPTFDYGNSPSTVAPLDFSGKIMVMKTTNGTQGILNASQADRILIACFLNAKATVDYIRRQQPKIVTLVAMGSSGENRLEDDECAYYLKALLDKKTPNFNKLKERIRIAKTAQKFFDPQNTDFPEPDFHYTLELNRFSFIMQVQKKEGKIEIVAVNS